MTLSAQQQDAVRRSAQDVCVVAGPGSGKTRVLIERFAWLVEERGIDPGRILAITFTEKAANEMKVRLVRRFEKKPELREAVERAWLSTIDGFCMRLLRENAIAAGLPPDFTVLDQSAADRMQREAAETALDELFKERPAEMRRLMEALDLSTEDDVRQPDLADSLLDVYASMRLAGARDLPPEPAAPDVLPEVRQLALTILNDPGFGELHEWTRDLLLLDPATVSLDHLRVLARFEVHLGKGSKSRPGYQAAKTLKQEMIEKLAAQWTQAWNAGLPDLLGTALSRLNETFREKKRQQAVVDFADLEERAILLLETDDNLRQRAANQFDQVLMDELQDTNRLQWRLVNLVRRNDGRSFFAVGDINQSIYGFRHADRTVFEEYRGALRKSGGCIDELTENYRSRRGILDTVFRALDGQPGIEHRPLEAMREFNAADGAAVERLVGLGEQGADVEAGLVAARISQWISSGGKLSDCVILVRTLSSTEPFERALDQLKIPFLVSGGRNFLEARETRDLMALLAALVNPLDEIALFGVLRSPLVGWSDEDILRAGREGWQTEFERLFGKARRLAGFVPPDRVLAMALDECGYPADAADRVQANIDKLLAWVRREHRQRPRPLAELLDDLEALRIGRAEADAPPPDATETVRIMSIHAAKGLEFRVVFVGALHRGPEKRVPAILFSADLGLGVKWRNPATGEGVSSATHAALAGRRKIEEEAEENRLLYVAMTRAEDRLILSYARRKQGAKWPKLVEGAVSAAVESDLVSGGQAEGLLYKTEPAAQIHARPAVEGQHDSSAAVTSVALFYACPRKYYLARYLGLEAWGGQYCPPQPILAAPQGIELGLEVHRALAGLSTDSQEALDLMRTFATSELGQRAARATRRESEFDFLLDLEDVILRGQIDLWFEEAGELVLVDYKTDRAEFSTTEYSLQVRLYALALQRYAGRVPDRAALCYLRSGNVVEVTLKERDLEGAQSAVREFSAAQNNLKFPMKAGEQCLRCTFYKGLCPSPGPSSGPFSEPPSFAPTQPTTDS
jgi:ATP-dependent helicase/nuclease subunit A